jgi:hypothetical protein
MRVKVTIRPDLKKCIETYGRDIPTIIGISDRLNKVYDLKFHYRDKGESWGERSERLKPLLST